MMLIHARTQCTKTKLLLTAFHFPIHELFNNLQCCRTEQILARWQFIAYDRSKPSTVEFVNHGLSGLRVYMLY